MKAFFRVGAIALALLFAGKPTATTDLTNMSDTALLMAYDEMGQECEQMGNPDRALFWYTLGMKTHPSFYECRFVRFNVRDRKELEEKLRTRRDPPSHGTPWSKETARPASVVYVYAEEGFGDTIHFCRYLCSLAHDGYRIIFRPQAPLARLMAHSFGEAVTVEVDLPEGSLPFDTYVPLLSLPHHYLTKVENIPHSEGYLKADSEIVEQFRKAHFEKNNLFKVGIVWQGCLQRFNDQNRSVRLADFLPLAEVEGVQFYALQVGPGREQLEEIGSQFPIIDLGAELSDFADSAAMIANLDLLISVDTSVAHLGGSLGHPTWILIPYLSDWRWFRKRDRSPWYNSATLFRQEKAGDWTSTMARLKKQLQKCVRERNGVNQGSATHSPGSS